MIPTPKRMRNNKPVKNAMMQNHYKQHQGSFIHTLRFKVDQSIILEGFEICISRGPTELVLTLSKCKNMHQRELQRLNKVFKAENNRDACLGMFRNIHVSFTNPVTLEKDQHYLIHATIKCCEFFSHLREYRMKLNFDGVCLSMLQGESKSNHEAIFTALTFRNIHDAVRRKIPITI